MFGFELKYALLFGFAASFGIFLGIAIAGTFIEFVIDTCRKIKDFFLYL